MKLAGVACFPGLDAPIPNFVGSERATRLLCELPMWKRAKVISVNCDAPQLAIRRAALRDNKVVYMAIPRLRSERCFVELDPERLGPKVARVSSIVGAIQFGRLVAPSEMRPVDLIVCGSVAVTRQGGRLGRGGGGSALPDGAQVGRRGGAGDDRGLPVRQRGGGAQRVPALAPPRLPRSPVVLRRASGFITPGRPAPRRPGRTARSASAR